MTGSKNMRRNGCSTSRFLVLTLRKTIFSSFFARLKMGSLVGESSSYTFFFLSWLDWKLSYNVMSHSSSLWILMSPFKFQGKILDFCYSSIIGKKKKSWAPRGTMTRPQSKQLPLSRFDHEYWTSWKSEVRNTNTLHIFKVNDLCMTIIIRE